MNRSRVLCDGGLGREALERMAQPMVGGIYTADPETLSLRATLPRFLDMEREASQSDSRDAATGSGAEERDERRAI